ncbi:MAG: hypothetical protein ABI703_07365 [Gemmatimonadales bacterium]
MQGSRPVNVQMLPGIAAVRQVRDEAEIVTQREELCPVLRGTG